MSPTWITTATMTTTTPMTTNSEKGHLTERPSALAASQPAGRPSALPRRKQDIFDEEWMRLAIAEAAHTAPGDVPVGAVVVDAEGKVVGRGSNRREADGDPLAHAEVIALREATRAVGDGWRLEQCTLVVTLEPCVMCAGACVMGRVGRVVFGAWSPKTGACGSIADVIRDPAHAFTPQVRGGVLADECSVYLREFFERQRQSEA